MTDKEKIRAEVKRRKDELYYLPFTDENLGKINAYEFVLKIIDSLSEEPVSEDLEEYAESISNHLTRNMPDEVRNIMASIIKDSVELGAKCQKEQMMKDAVDGKVVARFPLASEPCYVDAEIFVKYAQNLNEGDKVKAIIIRED